MVRTSLCLLPFLALALACSVLPAAGIHKDQLLPGETLTEGQHLESPNGRWRAVMQPGGKFRILGLSPTTRVWVGGWQSPNAEEFDDDGAILRYWITMTPSGSLQIWNQHLGNSGRPHEAWHSNQKAGSYLQLTDKGQLEILQPVLQWREPSSPMTVK